MNAGFRSLLAASLRRNPVQRGFSAANQLGPLAREKRFVRIAGPASYASPADIDCFLSENGFDAAKYADEEAVAVNKSTYPRLTQGKADVFQNHSIWIVDAGSEEEAERITSSISGKVAGLKLVRAAAVDARLVEDFLGASAKKGHHNLRKRMSIIAPKADEHGRCLLATQLPHNLPPRHLWSFFGAYDVEAVRLLRKSCVACIVFSTSQEAERALRERANLSIHSRGKVTLTMHA